MKYLVQSKDFTKELSVDKKDDFLEVFATSRMVALMALAAARLMKPLQTDEQLSVGVNIDHFAATPK